MKKHAIYLKPVLAALVLGACSTGPKMPDKAWAVEPVQTVRHGASSAAGYYALGRYREGSGAGEEAIDAYRKAVEAEPGQVTAWSALGALQTLRGRFEEGLAALQKAVDLAPAASHLHNNLGYALLLAGREDAAANALRRAVELDGDNRRAWINLAAAYRRLGEHDKVAMAEARARGERVSAPAASVATASATPVTPVGESPRLAVGRVTVRTAEAGEGGNGGDGGGASVVRLADNVYVLRNGPDRAQAAHLRAASPPAPVTVATAPGAAMRAAEVIPLPPLADQPLVLAALSPLPPASLPALQSPSPAVASPAVASSAAVSTTPASPAAASPTVAKPAAVAGVRYEISNGHGSTGLARRLATLLGKEGVPWPRLTNQRPFTERGSFIQYRDGYRGAAESFAALLPFRPRIAAAPTSGQISDVRLVLGHDLNTSDACSVLEVCPRVVGKAAPVAALETVEAPLQN